MLQGSLNKVDSANAASGLYSFNSKGSGFIHSLVTFFYSGVGAAAIPARLRLRTNFGERAFSPAAVIVSVSFYIFLCSRIIFFFPDEKEGEDFLLEGLGILAFLLVPINSFSWFIINTIIKAYRHFKAVYSHANERSYKYSFYRGDPITEKYSDKIGRSFFGYEVDETLIRMYYEPKGFALSNLIKCVVVCVLLVVGGFFGYSSFLDSSITDVSTIILIAAAFWLATYAFSCLCLAFSGFCLLIEELSIAKKIRDTVLDMVDGEYDMQFVLKQKELLETSNGTATGQSLDLAEAIFQNPELANMASFPKMDFEQAEPVVSTPQPTYLVANKREVLAEPDVAPKPVQKTPTAKVPVSTARSKYSYYDSTDVARIIMISLACLVLCYGGYIYYKNGLLPATTYAVYRSADVAPAHLEFTLKTVIGGINTTVLNFEVKNTAADTLWFPFLDPNDQRGLKLEAKSVLAPYGKKTGIAINDSIYTVPLSPNQSFGRVIVVPPNETRTYSVEFGNYPYKATKEFSIVSEDKVLNRKYLLFKDVKL